MGLEFIIHNGHKYPSHESIGGASLWIRPLAQYYCDGKGLDIGYSKEAWMLPNAIGIEPSIDHNWDAMKLPPNKDDESLQWDFIHSSHCLEHVKANVYDVLDYWLSKIKVGGIVFLYLPHSSQSYWHPSSNRKHIHILNESEIETYLNDLGHKVYVSGCDWNHSFVVICEKVGKGYCVLNDEVDSAYMVKGMAEKISEQLKTQPREIKIQNDIPTGHYPVKDSLLYQFKNNDRIPPDFKTKYHQRGGFKFKLAETNDAFLKNCALIEVEFAGENFKTGFIVYPMNWNDVPSLEHQFDKFIVGVKMILQNR